MAIQTRTENGGLTHQHKELMARHHHMQQNKDKVEGTLISILLLTQITELKMLVDIGRQGHRLYDVVLALLVSSVGALVLVGLIVLYVSNLRFYRRSRPIARASQCCRVSETGCIDRCSACCFFRHQRGPTTTTVATSKGSRLTDSYVCVPLGVISTAEGARSMDSIRGGPTSDTIMHIGQSTANIAAVGCWSDDNNDGRREPQPSDAEFGRNRLELLDTAVEEARARLAALNARLASLRAEYDTRTGTMRKSTLGLSSDTRAPLATHHDDIIADDDSELAHCRRQKEAVEAELVTLEARRQRTLVAQRSVEETEEKAVFRAVMFWQHFTMYVLYFVCLMNIFITAFGIYNSTTSTNSGSSSSSGAGTGGGAPEMGVGDAKP